MCSDVDVGGETFFRRSRGYPGQALQPTASAEKVQGLSDKTQSGQTPQTAVIAAAGLKIPPKRGRAIMFW